MVLLIGEKNASPAVVAAVGALEEVEVVGVFELSSLFGEEDLEGLRRRRSGALLWVVTLSGLRVNV